tara:strand:+ start:186 stop:839 length:654 start_codon:yes stop_codon:yes gene_type:complete
VIDEIELLDQLEIGILSALDSVYDDCGEPGWIKFEDLLLKLDDSIIEASDEQRELSSGSLTEKVEKAVEKLIQDDFIEAFEDQRLLGNGIRLTGHGSYSLHGPNILVSDELAIQSAEAPLTDSELDSMDWTGLSKSVSSEDLKRIRGAARQLRSVIAQSDVDSSTRDDALRRVDAVVDLLEAPNVPWKQIVEILRSPYLNAFLISYELIKLIVGLYK